MTFLRVHQVCLFVNQGFDEIAITPLWVTLNLTVAVVAAFTVKAVKVLGNRTALMLIVFYIPSTYIFLGWLPLVPALLSLYFFILSGGMPHHYSRIPSIKIVIPPSVPPYFP